jgi:hypothetical protein|tara:strand:+ start:96 stop:323 length:228 start_codon:yes stop_codon:yes gene_type:complete
MQSITEKQILIWKEELKNHREKLSQAQAVVEQEVKFISMIEGGIQFGELILSKHEEETQQKGTIDLSKETSNKLK